jgi:hypothetical protein
VHPIGGYDLCGRVVILAVMLAMAPLGGFYARRTIDFALKF